jgi:23S rRNA pseudouridine1911/1915/1917 synthase
VIEHVPGALHGERLDRVVSLLTGATRSAAAAWIAGGRVMVGDDVVTSKSHRLVADDVVTAPDVDPGPAAIGPDPDVEVVVVHEDDDLVVVDKPAGLVVHPGAGAATGTLAQGLLARYPEMAVVGEPDRPGIVHRLDKDTSGLLVAARTEAARAGLAAQFAAHSTHRRYDALVWGAFEAMSGTIEARIGRSPRHPTRFAVVADGRPATTDYEVVTAFTSPVEVARVACRLHTGRTHQIRVHLSSIGHPVVGDDRYGGAREAFGAPRQMLHAATLGFEHPRSGERLQLAVPPPEDFSGVLDRLA